MNGQQALDLLRERHPDVMLLDLVLPGKDGFQVLKEKSQDAEISVIPVIVISSLDPVGTPIISNSIEITRKGGVSIKDLLASIQAVSEILAAPGRPKDRESTTAAPA
jgi:DNA-binding response OmpR family regulator